MFKPKKGEKFVNVCLKLQYKFGCYGQTIYHMIKKQDHLGIPNLAFISNERAGFEWRKREMGDHSEETWLEFGF